MCSQSPSPPSPSPPPSSSSSSSSPPPPAVTSPPPPAQQYTVSRETYAALSRRELVFLAPVFFFPASSHAAACAGTPIFPLDPAGDGDIHLHGPPPSPEFHPPGRLQERRLHRPALHVGPVLGDRDLHLPAYRIHLAPPQHACRRQHRGRRDAANDLLHGGLLGVGRCQLHHHLLGGKRPGGRGCGGLRGLRLCRSLHHGPTNDVNLNFDTRHLIGLCPRAGLGLESCGFGCGGGGRCAAPFLVGWSVPVNCMLH